MDFSVLPSRVAHYYDTHRARSQATHSLFALTSSSEYGKTRLGGGPTVTPDSHPLKLALATKKQVDFDNNS